METTREPKWKQWLRQLEHVERNPFTAAEAASVLTPQSTSPDVVLRGLCSRGLLHRVRPGRYFRHIQPSGPGSLFTKHLTVNGCDDQDLTVISKAVVASVTRLGLEPGSAARYEFLNNHILWNQWRLQSGDLEFPRRGATAPAATRLVLFQSIDRGAAKIFRDSIDATYDENEADDNLRAVVDAALQLWVCALYAKDGFVPFLNETTGKAVLPDFLKVRTPGLKLVPSTPVSVPD